MLSSMLMIRLTLMFHLTYQSRRPHNHICKSMNCGLPVSDPNLQSGEVPVDDHTAGPIFSLGHSEAARLLNTACTQRKLEFHNSNWLIVCHFFSSSDNNDTDYVPQVQLILCSHNVSFNSSVVNEINFNYSNSFALHLFDSRHMPNAD